MSNTPDKYEFHRIAVLNRGEPAVRFMRAIREYNLERDVDFEAIAFYTDPDADAPFVRMADEAVHLGPAMTFDASSKKASWAITMKFAQQAVIGSFCTNARKSFLNWAWMFRSSFRTQTKRSLKQRE